MPPKSSDNRATDKILKRTRQKAPTQETNDIAATTAVRDDNSPLTSSSSTPTKESDSAEDRPDVKRPRLASRSPQHLPPNPPPDSVPTTVSHETTSTAPTASLNNTVVTEIATNPAGASITQVTTQNSMDEQDVGTPISGWNASGDEADNNNEALPVLANNHPDFRDVNYIPFPTLQRAVSFASMQDATNNRYAITHVPNSARWGSTSTTERVLCYNDRPLTIWLVGIVVSTWFSNTSGVPHQRVNIGVRLPHVDDTVHARNLYRRSRPERAYTQDVFYASKYMGRQTRGSAEVTATAFQEIYDAQHRFRAKREMSLMPAAYIAKNDLVLVEAAFTRWKTAKDKKNNRDWTIWDVGFELQAISLLFEAPPAAEDNEYRTNDNIHDDM